jgi:hypothetical protein
VTLCFDRVRWVAVDPVTGVIDGAVEEDLGETLAYVVAFGGGAAAPKDVTHRCGTRAGQTDRMRFRQVDRRAQRRDAEVRHKSGADRQNALVCGGPGCVQLSLACRLMRLVRESSGSAFCLSESSGSACMGGASLVRGLWQGMCTSLPGTIFHADRACRKKVGKACPA